ncbi:MAG: MmcQ/YjbR family DNA-binding protein [Clostridia bacterium]|nr:MmcQ/YjbR family DNA-binding protein [Clostridia bacterium]
MDRKDIIKYSLSLPDTFEDYPFPDDNISVTMKHRDNKKWFALIMNVKDKIYLNVKTDPNYSELLRNSYDYIIPGYHMNKEHWNTIIIDNKVDVSLVKELIRQSYELTKKV